MALHIRFENEELPALKQLLNRALNCWDPMNAPKWAFELDELVKAKIESLRESDDDYRTD